MKEKKPIDVIELLTKAVVVLVIILIVTNFLRQ